MCFSREFERLCRGTGGDGRDMREARTWETKIEINPAFFKKEKPGRRYVRTNEVLVKKTTKKCRL